MSTSPGGWCARYTGVSAPPEPAVDTLAATPPPGAKLVHFIRHGEGHHNVAQREWRADPAWDGKTEPYTLETDPDMKYVDAELNDKGRGQAQDLTSRTEPTLRPQLMVCVWPTPLTLR